MIDIAIWICPALCGCKIQMTADWLDGDVRPEEGSKVSYRHPKSFTLSNLSIVNSCDSHASLMRSWVVPADPYGGAPGYLKVPEHPTDAEKLYIYLYRYAGGVHTMECGCRGYMFHDRHESKPESTYCPHPLHTLKCEDHQDDTPDHQKARGLIS